MSDSWWKFGNACFGCTENELFGWTSYLYRHVVNTGYWFNLLVIQTLPYGQPAQIDLMRPHWVNEYPASVNLLNFYVSFYQEKKKCFPAHSLFTVTYKMRLMTIDTGLRQLVWQAAHDGLDSYLESFLSILHCLQPMHSLSNVEPPLHIHIRECIQFSLEFCFQWCTCSNFV